MVAVAPPALEGAATSRRTLGWTVGGAIVLVVGVGLRLTLGGTGVGDRSAIVMGALLVGGVWLAARLLGGARTAFAVGLGLMALFDVAALPQRDAPEYDGVEAWYRTDQVVTSQVAVSNASVPALTLLVQPFFTGPRPSFGLAGEVNGVALKWNCPFERDIQRLVLPIPREAIEGASILDVTLHLSGSPTRESDYLTLYTSSKRGGPLISVDNLAASGQVATACSRS